MRTSRCVNPIIRRRNARSTVVAGERTSRSRRAGRSGDHPDVLAGPLRGQRCGCARLRGVLPTGDATPRQARLSAFRTARSIDSVAVHIGRSGSGGGARGQRAAAVEGGDAGCGGAGDWAAPATPGRRRGQWRRQVLLKGDEPAALVSQIEPGRGWSIDIDPVD